MRRMVKLLAALSLAAVLGGCVVAQSDLRGLMSQRRWWFRRRWSWYTAGTIGGTDRLMLRDRASAPFARAGALFYVRSPNRMQAP